MKRYAFTSSDKCDSFWGGHKVSLPQNVYYDHCGSEPEIIHLSATEVQELTPAAIFHLRIPVLEGAIWAAVGLYHYTLKKARGIHSTLSHTHVFLSYPSTLF